MKLKFRDLYADEIECRVGATKDNGFQLLLYKNARVDMALLDEVVGGDKWQREHLILGNDIYCRVGIWNEEIGQWVWKMDAGAEANTEIEKSKASDSFKRACTNFGLGRCLYSAPFIWISTKDRNGNPTGQNTRERYIVKEIGYKDHKITNLAIINDKTKEVVFLFNGDKKNAKKGENEPLQDIVEPQEQVDEPKGSIEKNDLTLIQAYISAFNREESRTKFYNYLDNTYGTMNVEMLTKTQGKEVIKLLRGNK